jgi:hypothetical protein
MSSNTGSFRLLQNTQTWKGTVTKWLNRTKLKASVDIHNRVGADALWTHADGGGVSKGQILCGRHKWMAPNKIQR